MTYTVTIKEEVTKASLHPTERDDIMTTTTTIKRHWYAIEWAYGIGTYWQDNPLPCGAVRIFDTEQARDKWVAFDPDLRRSATDANTAARMMHAAVRTLPFDHDKPSTAEQLIDMYRYTDPYCTQDCLTTDADV